VAQQVKDPATVAWVAAMEQVASLACDLPHTMGAAKKKKKKSAGIVVSFKVSMNDLLPRHSWGC